MTERDTNWPTGTPCWVDLAVDDFPAAQRFYSALFGWEMEQGPAEYGGYATATLDGRAVAGLAPKMSPDQPTVWTTYLACENLDATLAKVPAHGGQVVAEAMDVGEMGRMALAVDPGGAFVGFWQGRAHTGFQLANEPGSVTWNENMTTAYKDNLAFYRELVGWEYDDLSGPGFEYATFKVDGAVAGGIGGLGPDTGDRAPTWTTYFKVADADVSCAEVERLGGTVTAAAWDTEFGRMAAVTDDQGAAFMLMADAAPAEVAQ
jgi:predicted enzyme related to lactoylglutathione lyase